jgi:hypothetical protein
MIATITVKDIINDAYKSTNLIGDGQSLQGDQLTQGLRIFNKLSDLYNQQEYLPFTQKRTRLNSKGSHCIVLESTSDTTFELPLDDEANQTDFTEIKMTDIPLIISKLSYKMGIRWCDVANTGFEDLQNYIIENNTSIPDFYSYSRKTYVDSEDKLHVYGEIWLNIASYFELQIVYNRSLPDYNINSIFNAPGYEYIELFQFGIAHCLAVDKMLDDDIVQKLANRETAAMNLIKNTNQKQHKITYGDGQDYSTWYNIMSPKNWSNV